MESDSGNLEGFVDAIADRVLGRLTGRPNRGPTGEPASQLPDLSEGQEEIPSLVVVPGFAFRDSSSLNRPSTTAPDMGRRIPCLSVDLEAGRHLITATIPGGGANDRVQATGIIIVGGR